MRFELVFPRPRAVFQLTDRHRLYVAGELGGGTWAIERVTLDDDLATYRDLRVCIGVEYVEKDGSAVGLRDRLPIRSPPRIHFRHRRHEPRRRRDASSGDEVLTRFVRLPTPSVIFDRVSFCGQHQRVRLRISVLPADEICRGFKGAL